jgi:hypothetical protein
MGCHPKYTERITRELSTHVRTRRQYLPGTQGYARHTGVIDRYLDELYHVTHRATEWDADRWGFSDTWMKEERMAMESNKDMVKGIDGRWYEIQRSK